MTVKEHKPPKDTYEVTAGPTIFLAGPILGARDWQHNAVEIFEQAYRGDKLLHLFNPRRDTFEGSNYEEQVRWEQEQLTKAARVGALLFWFEPRNYDLPYPEGREYAKTTRKELGMAIGTILFSRAVRIAVGIDPKVEDPERYFRTTLDRLGIEVYQTLADTCRSAVESLERSPRAMFDKPKLP
ncbi:MAG: nucleoside 2-deoxyribosyltransferase domain-containing protein [Candidatus Saccharimonadales bacterium]